MHQSGCKQTSASSFRDRGSVSQTAVSCSTSTEQKIYFQVEVNVAWLPRFLYSMGAMQSSGQRVIASHEI